MPNHSIRYLSVAALVFALTTGCQKKEAAASTEVEVQATVARNAPITEHIAADDS